VWYYPHTPQAKEITVTKEYTWDQSAGALYDGAKLISPGYSGKGRGKNNPSLQGMQGVGPIPAGRWKMVNVYNSAKVGKFTITLHSMDDAVLDDTHTPTGRGAFRIHGDSIREPGSASNGCIILPLAIRKMIYKAGNVIIVRA
jgi:hypothetical protein